VQKASELVKKAEEDAKRLEADAEKKSKEAGEALMSTRMQEAKTEAENIRSKTKSDASEIERKTKENMSRSIDVVVDVIIKKLRALD
jgi:vacuolar-type H+-ATPase subunit H